MLTTLTTSELIEQLDNSYDSVATISSLTGAFLQETATTAQRLPVTSTQSAEIQEASPIDCYHDDSPFTN